MAAPLRYAVKNLYKQFIHVGGDYPGGIEYARPRIRKAFLANKEESDPEKIQQMIDRGNYVLKEMEAVISLKQYRTLKRRYYKDLE